MKVMKFGGTSVGTAESIRSLLNIVSASHARGEHPLVILSAMGGVTNLLNQLAEEARLGKEVSKGISELENRHFSVIRQLVPVKDQNHILTQIRLTIRELERVLSGISNLGELSAQSRDQVLSFGERCAALMVSGIAAHYLPLPAFVDARQLIRTNSQFGQAQVHAETTNRQIRAFVAEHPESTLFVTGFIASDAKGCTTTLGRGGSDYTAALFGAALGATAIEIWTDVDGMLTADPRVVRKALPLTDLSYAEAMELSYFGAKVIYPPTMVPAFQHKIPIVIRNTFNPDFKGTAIRHEVSFWAFPIKGISYIEDISLVNITGSGMVGKSGFSGRLFSLLARDQINVVLITQSSSERSITFAVQPQDLLRTRELIESEFELEIETHKLVLPEIEDNLSVLAIVGENMKNTPGMSGKLFHALGRNGINVRAIAQGSSELNISVILSKSDLAKAMNAVHDAFFATLNKTLNVFVAGTGNIGATFFEQLRQQHQFLLENNDMDIRIIGICNSRKQLIGVDGLSLDQWDSDLRLHGKQADFEEFMQTMETLNLPNCVFVDNTSSPVVPTYYQRIFSANISIVTCNKIANSGPYEQYKLLKNTARMHGVDFFYETNVGAGLPIVRVLKDLMFSGDRILKIEAILSGTISYLFNNYGGERRFDEVVRQAQALGYTEPDPRDDLNGSDFVRKMLILGRDAGYSMEADEVSMVSIMPKACLEAPSVDEFYQQLAFSEPHFEAFKKEAEADGKVLRYIGKLEAGKISIALEMVGPDHPFFHLSGSDNIIAFTTERYKERPLLVRGPGAGAAVTAAGVFADLVNVGGR